DSACRRRLDVRSRIAKVRMIERVCRVDPKLQARALPDLEVLGEPEAEVEHSGPGQNAVPGRAKAAGVGWRDRKCRHVKPTFKSPLTPRQIAISNSIRAAR